MENRSKTKITFHAGLDSIGGVIMEVRYEDCRAFFEAGLAYDPSFDLSHLKKRNPLSDLLYLKQLPMIDGIYAGEDLDERISLIPYEDYPIDEQAFFVSHLHLDHMAMMGMIAPDITVFLTRPAQILERALEDVGMGVDDLHHRSYTDMPEEVTIGKIRVKRFILNEDSYQDLSFYIETPDLKIHFTGDVFVYGKYEAGILKEVQFLKKNHPDILVCEGTRFSSTLPEDTVIEASFENRPGLLSKEETDRRIIDIVDSYKGLVVFNYYLREMSDVMLFEEVGEKTKRKIVYEPESAHLINCFFHRSVNVMVPDTYDRKPDYLEAILEENTVVDKEEVMKDPAHYLVQNSYPNILELLDYREEFLYLHHSGEPLGTFDRRYENMKRVLNLCPCRYVHAYEYEDGHFSSHAEAYQILAYIDMVNADLCVPCHTLNRKAMLRHMKEKGFAAEKGKTYVYDRERKTLVEDDG